MNLRSFGVAAGIGLTCFLGGGLTTQTINAAHAAELRVLAANGVQSVVEELAPKFEQATGHKLVITFATGGAVVKRAQDGEAADVVMAPQPGILGLVKGGKVAAGNTAAFASTGISVAVRKGTAKMDIATPDAFRRTLLAAKSVTYLNPADGAASGIHFAKVLDSLGITNELKSKRVLAPSISALGSMVAKGEAEIGVLQYQLLFTVPGIEIIGPLPGDLQDSTVFAAAMLDGSKESGEAKALLSFMRTPEAAAVIKAKGMDPVAP